MVIWTDFSDHDRATASVGHSESAFEAPNELGQLAAQQLQDRGDVQTVGQTAWQRGFTPDITANVSAMERTCGSGGSGRCECRRT